MPPGVNTTQHLHNSNNPLNTLLTLTALCSDSSFVVVLFVCLHLSNNYFYQTPSVTVVLDKEKSLLIVTLKQSKDLGY